MAQFVTHIQPTLIEASHHHIPHPHHHKEHHEKHDKHHKEHEKQHKEYDKHHKEFEKYKEVIEHQQCSKDHSLKEKLSSKIYLPVVGELLAAVDPIVYKKYIVTGFSLFSFYKKKNSIMYFPLSVVVSRIGNGSKVQLSNKLSTEGNKSLLRYFIDCFA